MAKLNIPERHRASVAAIRELDEASVQAIRDALDGTTQQKTADFDSTPGTPNDFAITALTTVSATKSVGTKQIADAIAGLYAAKSARDVSTEDFVEEVCDAMESLPSEELRLPHAERASFKAKLSTILGAELFSLVAKVYDLATEDERIFCSARILTDLRPVFGLSVSDGPRAFIVTHLLKVAYHQGSKEHKNFYVTLDADDLQRLKGLIERAESKARSLKSAVRDIRTIGVPKE